MAMQITVYVTEGRQAGTFNKALTCFQIQRLWHSNPSVEHLLGAESSPRPCLEVMVSMLMLTEVPTLEREESLIISRNAQS